MKQKDQILKKVYGYIMYGCWVVLGTQSQVIRTSSPQEDESPAQTPQSCRLCRVLMTYMPLGIMVYAGPSLFLSLIHI